MNKRIRAQLAIHKNQVMQRHTLTHDVIARVCREVVGRLITLPTGPGKRMTAVVTACEYIEARKQYRVMMMQSGVYVQGPYFVKSIPEVLPPDTGATDDRTGTWGA